MPIDANILLNASAPNVQPLLGAIANIPIERQRREEAPYRQQLLQAQVDNIPIQQQQAQLQQESRQAELDKLRQDTQIQGGVYGALKAKSYLDSGDTEGFMNFANTRQQNIASRGGDPSDTQRIAGLVQAGRVDEAKALIDQEIKAGQMLGILKEPTARQANTSTALNDGLALGLQGDPLREYVDKRTIKESGSGSQPYFQFLPTSTGYAVGNARTGQIQTPGAQGEALLPVSADTGLATRMEGGKEAGKTAITQSNDAMKSLSVARGTIANMDDAIKAIDEGASSGVIASMLPSVKKSSLELENARRRLGLNVIQGTTFGALSEGELKLALDTAVPSGLQPADLKAWLQNRKAAQSKLANQLEDAAVYLGTPGNTAAGYMESLRNQRQQGAQGQPAPAQGGIPEGSTATNPQTGQKIVFRGGQWQAQ